MVSPLCSSLKISVPQGLSSRVYIPGVISSYFCVFCYLRPGPHYFCSWLLSQSPDFLLLTFSSSVVVILLNANCMIILLLRLTFWLVPHWPSNRIQTSSPGFQDSLCYDCCLPLSFTALFFPSPAFLCSSSKALCFSCQSVWTHCPHPVFGSVLPTFLVSNSSSETLTSPVRESGNSSGSAILSFMLPFYWNHDTLVLCLSGCIPVFSLGWVECSSVLRSLSLSVRQSD